MPVNLRGDRERVQRVIDGLRHTATTQGAKPVTIDPVDAEAVLNVLTGLTRPIAGQRGDVIDGRDTWERGPEQ